MDHKEHKVMKRIVEMEEHMKGMQEMMKNMKGMMAGDMKKINDKKITREKAMEMIKK